MDQHTTRQSAVPGLLWAVIAMFAVVAAFMLYPTMVFLRLGAAAFSAPAFGLLGLAVALAMGSLVVAFARVGYGLFEGSRVARGIAFVLAGELLLACFAMPVATGLVVVLALASLGVVAVLAVAPSARAFFAGPWARRTELPTSIVLAQVVVLYSSGITALLAATLLVAGIALLSVPYIGGIAGLMIVGALLCAGIAGVGFWAKAAIGRAAPLARVLVTAATVADLVVVVLLTSADESVLPLVASFGLHTAVVIALWLPTDARRFFGEDALPVVESLHRWVLEISQSSSAGPSSPWPGGNHPGLPLTTPSGPRAATPEIGRHRGTSYQPGPSHHEHGRRAAPHPMPIGPESPATGVPSPVGPPPGTPPPGQALLPRGPNPPWHATSRSALDPPAFCGRCGGATVPGAVHCVRCGARLIGPGITETQP